MLTLVLVVVLAALVFEFINGFHDTANSIAASVATKVLTPGQAVSLAAVMNMIGALTGTAVAATIATGIVNTEVVGSEGRRDLLESFEDLAAWLWASGAVGEGEAHDVALWWGHTEAGWAALEAARAFRASLRETAERGRELRGRVFWRTNDQPADQETARFHPVLLFGRLCERPARELEGFSGLGRVPQGAVDQPHVEPAPKVA
jgi:hypothetical protein